MTPGLPPAQPLSRDGQASGTVTFTFVCLAKNQVASMVDIQALAPEGYRQHALGLLREHASAETVEIWRDEGVWEIVARDGVRAIKPAEVSPSATDPEHAAPRAL